METTNKTLFLSQPLINILMVHMHEQQLIRRKINISAKYFFGRKVSEKEKEQDITISWNHINLKTECINKSSTLAGLVISMHMCLCSLFSLRCLSAELKGETDLRNVCQTVSSCNRLSHPSSLFIQAETSGAAGALSFVSVGVHVSNNYVYVNVCKCVS